MEDDKNKRKWVRLSDICLGDIPLRPIDMGTMFTAEALSKTIDNIEDWNTDTDHVTDITTVGQGAKACKDIIVVVKDKST